MYRETLEGEPWGGGQTTVENREMKTRKGLVVKREARPQGCRRTVLAAFRDCR